MKKSKLTLSSSKPAARKLALRREAIVTLAPPQLADVVGGGGVINREADSVFNGCTTLPSQG